MIKQLHYLLKTMRLRQWPKNVFVYAGLVFDGQLIALDSLVIVSYAFILFCLASSLIYIINDLTDIDADRLHPKKKHRPLASGKLSQKTAIISAIFLSLIIFPAAYLLNINFGLVLTGYFLLMLAYSLWLKRVPLIDVMIIASGFVLRVAAGVVAFGSAVRSWNLTVMY